MAFLELEEDFRSVEPLELPGEELVRAVTSASNTSLTRLTASGAPPSPDDLVEATEVTAAGLLRSSPSITEDSLFNRPNSSDGGRLEAVEAAFDEC